MTATHRLPTIALLAVMIIAGPGCQEWQRELDITLGRLDGGTSLEADGGSDGGTDAGHDAGHDGGCTSQLCLVQALDAGASFRPVTTVVGANTLIAAGRASAGIYEQLAISGSDGFVLGALHPNIFSPLGLLAFSPSEYFVAAESGAAYVADGGARITGACGTSISFPTWWSVSGTSSALVTFVGDFGAICTFTDGGFTGTQMEQITQPPEAETLYGIKSFEAAGNFIVGAKGLLMHWQPPNGATVYRHSAAEAQFWDMTAIDGESIDALWAVGEYGVLARWQPNTTDGGGWTELPMIPGVSSTVRALWVRDNDDVWVVGEKGLLKHWNGTEWSNVAAEHVDGTVDLKGVHGLNANDLVLAGTKNLPDGGELGLLLRYRRN